jgi:hypothetical protein
MTMTAATTGAPVITETFSLEVRWIIPGRLDMAVAEWFDGFPSELELREDAYILDPDLGGLSVKVRADKALELKAFHGSPGILDFRGRARGRMQYWRKWSIPFRPPSRGGGNRDGWRRVRKRRRTSRFSLAQGRIPAPAGDLVGPPRCAVELTEIRLYDQDWWSLGLEAAGPAHLLRAGLLSTAALVFTQPLPWGTELRVEDSMSYAEWLRQSGRLP